MSRSAEKSTQPPEVEPTRRGQEANAAPHGGNRKRSGKMRRQIYQNQISAERYPQVTRFFPVLPCVRTGETEEGGKKKERGFGGGYTEGVEGNLDCQQDYRATADCEVNRKQRRHLNKLCVREAERSKKAAAAARERGLERQKREEAPRMDSVGTGKAFSLVTLSNVFVSAAAAAAARAE